VKDWRDGVNMNQFLFVAREVGKLQKADDQAGCSLVKKKKRKEKKDGDTGNTVD